MAENTFPVYGSDAIVNFFRTEVLTDLEAKHFSKGDLVPVPKVTSVYCRLFPPSAVRYRRPLRDDLFTLKPKQKLRSLHQGGNTNTEPEH